MNRFLAALALACIVSPAFADASDPVTWGGLSAVMGGIGIGLLILVALAVVLFVVGGIIISMWSH